MLKLLTDCGRVELPAVWRRICRAWSVWSTCW